MQKKNNFQFTPESSSGFNFQLFLSFRCIVCIMLAFSAIHLLADDRDDIFAKKIKLSTGKGAIYHLLKEVSEQSGYSFIYDSEIIENDKKVTVKKGEYTLRDAIIAITGNSQLQIDVLGNHILLRLLTEETGITIAVEQTEKTPPIILRGTIYDDETLEPIPYVNVGITGTTIGSISNLNGKFQISVIDSKDSAKIKLSHVGYETMETDFSLFAGRQIDFFLKPRDILLDEITVSIADPQQILHDIHKYKAQNYSNDPAYLTCFYREGIDYKQRNIDLTEAVLQIYKSGSMDNSAHDQVKLIKKRRIIDHQKNDTILPRMKSGINSCLVLDIIKEVPDFIDPANNSLYSYSFSNVTTNDNRLVNIVSFIQKPSVKEPLYTGDLYVEVESKALVKVQFDMNPRLVDKATNYFVAKKSRDLNLSLQEAKYMVSYKPTSDGLYYINHIRGDIVFKIRKRNHLFSNPLHFWFEMVTCKIDTEDVKGFSRNERLLPDRIFAETKHAYDQDFWENFNLILPEERLLETMINNLNEVINNEELTNDK